MFVFIIFNYYGVSSYPHHLNQRNSFICSFSQNQSKLKIFAHTHSSVIYIFKLLKIIIKKQQFSIGMFIREFCQKIQATIKKSKYRLCVIQIENFIEREGPYLFDFSQDLSIDLFFLQNYCCHKIIERIFLFFHEQVQIRLSVSLIQIMLRNVNFLYNLLDSFINENQILFSNHSKITKIQSLSSWSQKTKNSFSQKHFNKILESILMLSKDFSFYYDFMGQKDSKLHILEKTVLLIEETQLYYERFPKKSKKHKKLEVEILSMYGVVLYKSGEFQKALLILEKSMVKLIFNIANFQRNLLKKQRTCSKFQDTNDLKKSKKLKKADKNIFYCRDRIKKFVNKSYSILFFNIVYIAICNIATNHYSRIQSLKQVILSLVEISSVKKISKNYHIFDEIMEIFQSVIDSHVDFLQFFSCIINKSEKIENMIENLRKNYLKDLNQQAYRKKYNNKRESQIQSESTHTKLNQIINCGTKQKGLKVFFQVFNQIIKESQSIITNLSKNQRTNNKQFNNLEQSFTRGLWNSVDKFTGSNFSRRSQYHSKRNSSNRFSLSLTNNMTKIKNNKTSTREVRNSLKKKDTQSSYKQAKDQLIKKNKSNFMKEKLYHATEGGDIQQFNLVDGDCYLVHDCQKKKQKEGTKNSLTKSSNKKEIAKIAKNSLVKTIMNCQFEKGEKKIHKFYKLLIKNKNFLGIPEYCSKIDSHLKKEQLRQKMLKLNNQRQSEKNIQKMMRNTHQVFINRSEKQKLFVNLMKFQSLNYRQQQKRDSKSSICSRNSFECEQQLYNKQKKQELEEKKNLELEIKRQICYKKSFETINQLKRKLQNKNHTEGKRKLLRKSQIFYESSNSNNFGNDF